METFRLKTKIARQMSAAIAFFKSIPRHFMKSMTFDNGGVFFLHHELTKKIKIPTYFRDVYTSWQKEGIEDMNGRLRRDLPLKTDLINMRDEDLEQIVFSHNLPPKKVFDSYSLNAALILFICEFLVIKKSFLFFSCSRFMSSSSR